MSKTILIAYGGNALILDKEHVSIQDQYEVVEHTILPILNLIKEGWNVIITHGNGPQVGFVLRRSSLASSEVPVIPMDYAGADIQGAIGYMFNKALRNLMRKNDLQREVVSIVTEVVVDKKDSNFGDPSKPIGAYMTQEEAEDLQKKYGWDIIEDAGRGWRRVVASPKPLRIVELPVLKDLLNLRHLIVTCGGGGIPVYEDEEGTLLGIECVIDKDFASALLAKELQVDVFVIATAVEKVAIGFGTEHEKWLDTLRCEETEQYLKSGEFHKGSMEPKVRAMLEFVSASGKKGLITSVEKIMEGIRGETGTHFIR